MFAAPEVHTIGDKIRLLRVQTNQTKTTCISLILLLPLRQNTAENTVLASFLSHSSEAFPTLSGLNARLEELYGAVFSGDVSKLGEGYRLRLSLTCISDALALDGERLSEEGLRLLLDQLLEPHCADGKFDEKQLATEIRLCAEDIESEINDKRAYALGQMLEIMCADEPYGIKKTDLLEGVRAVTPQSIYKTWRELLEQATVTVQVVGNVDFAPLETMLRERFAEIPRKPAAIDTLFVECAEDVTEVTEEMTLNQSKLVLGLRTGMQNADDDFFAERIMVDVLGGGPYSRFFVHVREELSLCYYCSARLERRKGIVVIQSGVEYENKQAALDAILKQIEVMKRGEFTDEELTASKAALCDAYRGVNDTPEGIDAYYAQFAGSTPQSPDEIVAGLESVTREQVVAAANRLTLDTVFFLAGKGED